MNRRDALSAVGLIVGGTVIGSQAFLTGCSTQDIKSEEGLLTDKQIAWLNELGEVILPKTEKSPGAKEVNVGSFMNAIVSDFYTEDEQRIFVDGIKSLNELCNERFEGAFHQLTRNEQQEILHEMELEAANRLRAQQNDESLETHYYIMMKQLTIWGYLSSEAVAFNAFNHMVLTPKFEGCVSVDESTKPIFREAGEGQAYGYAIHHMKYKQS